jgi:zinc protease
MKKRGIGYNATTWFDRTNYFASFTADDATLDWLLALEADRMVNSFVARKDLDSEMTVVRNEMEAGENSPTRVLMARIASSAHLWHNYGNSTIGARADVENMPIERLQDFYRTWYRPDNATLLVAGRIDPARALASVQASFGAIAKPAAADPGDLHARAGAGRRARVSSVGIALSEAIAAGDWRLLFLGRQQLDTVTPEAVQAAAVRYLLPANRSTVRFLPGTDPKVEVPEAPALPTLLATLGPDPGPMGVAAFPTDPAEIAARVQTVALRPGLTLHLLPKPARNQAVQLALSLQIGDEAALAGKTTALQALGAMLNRGAGELDRVAFTDAVNAAGAELGLSAGGARIEASGRGKREQLPALLDLAALALKSPRFDAGEFEQWKSQQRTALERAREQPQSRAGLALAAALDPYPAGHPYASRDLDAQAAALEALTLDEVRALHAELVGGRELVISVVGDFDAEAVQAQLAAQYTDWQQEAAPAWITRLPGKTKAGRTVVDLPGQANGALQAALPLALSDQHADYPPLVIADWILGGGGLSNRLATRIRQQDGLSYGAGSGLSVDERDPAGRWFAYAIAAPENLDRADAAMREELARFHRDGITAAELTEAREGWLKSRRVGLGDDGGIAGSLLGLGIHRRTLADEAKLEAAVAALDLDAVNAAIRRWMKPTDWHRVLAGDAAKIGKP